METSFRVNNKTQYIALGTRQKPSQEAKTVIDAPYAIYAVNVIRDSRRWSPQYETAKVVGMDGGDIIADHEFGNHREQRKVDKWLTDRLLLHQHPASRPKALLTKEEVLELLAEISVGMTSERSA